MRAWRQGLALSLALTLLGTAPGIALGNDPDCRALETDGAAGLDLQLLCTLGEIVGHYTGQSYETTADVPVLLLGGLVALTGTLATLATMLLIRIGRRWTAPRRPADDAWWACPRCHSINEPTLSGCYRCGATRDVDFGP